MLTCKNKLHTICKKKQIRGINLNSLTEIIEIAK